MIFTTSHDRPPAAFVINSKASQSMMMMMMMTGEVAVNKWITI